jgi:hypothetical protein
MSSIVYGESGTAGVGSVAKIKTTRESALGQLFDLARIATVRCGAAEGGGRLDANRQIDVGAASIISRHRPASPG